jgi:V/A-type H+-transporting ATPase subunit D
VARLNVPVTKSSALEVGRTLRFATEGFELLEQKRQILVMELLSWLARARTVEQAVNERLARAHESLRQAALAAGAAKLSREAVAIRPGHRVEMQERRLMGLHLATLSVQAAASGPEFSFADSSPRSDEVKASFTEALEVITQLAEIENAVFRLAQELKRTQRRVNALEKIFIPTYQLTLRYILEALEGHEREELVVMKMAKEKLERVRRERFARRP